MKIDDYNNFKNITIKCREGMVKSYKICYFDNMCYLFHFFKFNYKV